jgi:hypothetical protein
MTKLPTLLLVLCCLSLMACSKGQQINGHNTNTAYRSVKALKNRLSPDKRIEFEVSFWTIRDAKKDDDDFLDIVDGKTPDEIIVIGKEIYQDRKAAGFKDYEQYSSWEEMIARFGKERIDQENRRGGTKLITDKNKPNDSVIYKLPD